LARATAAAVVFAIPLIFATSRIGISAVAAAFALSYWLLFVAARVASRRSDATATRITSATFRRLRNGGLA
jgi:hypothetical protein